MLAWYPPEIVFILLVLLSLLLLGVITWRRLSGHTPGIWLKNALAFFLLLGILHFILLPDMDRRLASGFSLNVAATSDRPLFPALQTPTYRRPPDEVYAAALRAVERLPRFHLAAQSPDERRLQITVEVPTWRWWPASPLFTDDLTVVVDRTRVGSRLYLRSSSRAGRGDLGENRRHIAQFIQALQHELNNR